jgi:hypothetical protein
MDSTVTFQVDRVPGFIFRLETTVSLWMYCCLSLVLVFSQFML